MAVKIDAKQETEEKGRVLFVNNGPGFIAKAMMKALSLAGYKITDTNSDLLCLAGMPEPPEIFLVYFEDDVHLYTSTFDKLTQYIFKNPEKHHLFLIGTQAEINHSHELVPDSAVTKSFVRPVEPPAVIEALEHSLTSSQAYRRRILVVDDDPVQLRTLKTWLSEAYDVFMANSGQEALAFFDTNDADLILLDYEMPGISGLETFELLKKNPRAGLIPVIFLTSKDDRETVMKVLSVHPEKYILKSLSGTEILQVLYDFFKIW